MSIERFKNRLIAKIITRFPSLAQRFIASYDPLTSSEVPWTRFSKKIDGCTVAIVTTAGVHHQDQEPFNMEDPEGDPSYRIIDSRKPLSTLRITHDYYDHTDADKDINIVFPIERLKEFETERLIQSAAQLHYGFMGHITGRHIPALMNRFAPEVAQRLKKDQVDAVLLVPG